MSSFLTMGVLTCNRVSLLRDTLNSFSTFNSLGDWNLVLVDNGSIPKMREENKHIAAKYNMRYVFNAPSLSHDVNRRIETGVCRLVKEVLAEQTDFCCLLQDDWRCTGSVPIEAAWEFLNRYRHIGQVRMRSFKYDDTFDGGSSVNFVTHQKINFTKRIIVRDVSFDIGELHWVDCCNLMLRDTLDFISKPFNSEIERMESFHLKHPVNAQLSPGIFSHTGPQRIRHDLREKGFFNDANIS